MAYDEELAAAYTRIKELESQLSARAPAAGELESAIRELTVQCSDMSDAVELVASAARRWAALVWREPGTAPFDVPLLVIMQLGTVTDGLRSTGQFANNRWLCSGATVPHDDIVGWLPLDALPPPTEPAREER